jgi:hypothetical protein
MPHERRRDGDDVIRRYDDNKPLYRQSKWVGRVGDWQK